MPGARGLEEEEPTGGVWGSRRDFWSWPYLHICKLVALASVQWIPGWAVQCAIVCVPNPYQCTTGYTESNVLPSTGRVWHCNPLVKIIPHLSAMTSFMVVQRHSRLLTWYCFLQIGSWLMLIFAMFISFIRSAISCSKELDLWTHRAAADSLLGAAGGGGATGTVTSI